MNPTTEALAKKNQSLLRYQIGIAVIIAAIWWLIEGGEAALAAAYGAAVTVATTLLLAWRLKRAGEMARQDPRKSMKILYVGAVWRFTLAVILFALGIGYLQLYPLAMIVGFIVTQLAYIFVGLGTQRASD